MERYIYIAVIVLFVISGVIGYQTYTSKMADKEEKITDLSSEVTSLSSEVTTVRDELKKKEGELEQTKTELKEMRSDQAKTSDVFTYLRNSYFSQPLWNSSITSLAILLNDKEICTNIPKSKRAERLLCQNIFTDNGCYSYDESVNKETCAKMSRLVDREVEPQELVSLCENERIVEDGGGQVMCLVGFAKMTKKSYFCEQVCVDPIDSANCSCVTGGSIDSQEDCDKYYRDLCYSAIGQ